MRDMETLIDILTEILRLIPLILAYYIPALLAFIIWRERSPNYRMKAGLILAVGFGFIIFVKLLFQPGTQLAALALVSSVQIAAAMLFAYLTVYRLAD
ncbi:hypothetical protein E0L93_11655 [Rubrobacter taiwanensis]|uniref:Uncharacterized protein n=1 Tax=Rubrobacter taiwanensis TaxID=185139 RepID=A0A4R1BFK8_9ACTN|nr:hypothetical protein [Rubrobacter taiwanensis]TCJ15904.1 hypothetical protein E0L93_11655 [Rubrobacter taiwanensis]